MSFFMPKNNQRSGSSFVAIESHDAVFSCYNRQFDVSHKTNRLEQMWNQPLLKSLRTDFDASGQLKSPESDQP